MKLSSLRGEDAHLQKRGGLKSRRRRGAELALDQKRLRRRLAVKAS